MAAKEGMTTSERAIGIDIGGTFTDVVVHLGEGGTATVKTLTTPGDPAAGVIAALRDLRERGVLAAGESWRIVHATTLFANALITRDGASTGLVTTEGFRDALEIGTERKFELYDIFIARPESLVPRKLRIEARERMAPDGAVLISLDEERLVETAAPLAAAGVESLAVVFLHAYANPEHETRALVALEAAYPGLFLSASSEVAPEIGEYERASTTVANAYVKPLASRYLDNLAVQFDALEFNGSFFMMLSNGGLTHLAEARRRPVHLLESGPAAGALVAAHLGARAGVSNLLAFDMGGTTAKLALIEEGRVKIAYGFEAAREKRFVAGSGLPIRIPTVELIEIGAGGGSIARTDAMGLLRVGPDSAGAEPGPVCYGRGGAQPTVTDADLLLGYLDPGFFAGGSMTLDGDATAEVLENLAGEVGLPAIEVAWGIHDVVNENMASAARIHIAEQGRDPSAFALLATGGAGPVHACAVAGKLGIRHLICPASAGVASALGLLVAPARVDRVSPVASRLGIVNWDELEVQFQALEADAASVIAETGFDPAAAAVARLADMRFTGQGFEVAVSLQPGPYGAGSEQMCAKAFEEAYQEKYSRSPPEVEPEIINIRVSLTAETPSVIVSVPGGEGGKGGEGGHSGSRPAYFPQTGEFIDTSVHRRSDLAPGTSFPGPAIVEEAESTVVVPPGASVHIDEERNLIIDLAEEAT